MTQENHIVDSQLPLELDFKSLKAQGLAYIQKHSSTAWTNLNPSDPGVTILEQLCFAFTELGYCANFPMKDILTRKDGALQVENQFYKPATILTTSPITINDYTKFVIDQIPAVKNIIFKPIPSSFPFAKGIYKAYLLLDASQKDPNIKQKAIFEQETTFDTFSLLNTVRNLGELFLMPKVLTEKTYSITGNLELTSGYHYHDVLPNIIQNIQQYIFPDVTQTGYDVLTAQGETTNEIFNGPHLKNSWIDTKSIQPKRDTIQPFEITKLIHETEGVQSISNVTFKYNNEQEDIASCNEDELLVFDFPKSLTNPTQLQVHSEGKQHNANVNTSLLQELGNMQQLSSKVNTVASVVMEPSLPEGKYRDITSYYAIQNTFPEAYKVGPNAVNKNTPDYQVAQSRQLKGYLNLFDQMLSNQFAQLANIDKLFSFENVTSGSPTDLENYNATKTKEQKENPKYPVPFEVFSPTYFYQSLYKSVPNIEPLLRNNNKFSYGPVSESNSTLHHKKWISYQDDPYNTYMYGLLTAIEDDQINLKRRNDLLDHLLARHGVSPSVIDTIIYGTAYSGDVLKDRVIIKSVYLQNLDCLTYNRVKAYNYIGAQKLLTYLFIITPELINELIKNDTLIAPNQFEGDVSRQEYEVILANYNAKKELQKVLKHSYEVNGIFDIHSFDASQKISSQDVINYDTISLELSMMLTLDPFYINFIQEATLHQDSIIKKQAEVFYAFWMYSQRKGVITIETNLLANAANFEVFIAKKVDTSYEYYQYTNSLNYKDAVLLGDAFQNMPAVLAAIILCDTTAWKKVMNPSNEVLNYSTPIGTTNYKWNMIATWDGAHNTSINHPFFSYTFFTIFPNFIPEFMTPEWENRLGYFMDSQLPLHVSQHTMYLSAENLQTLIPSYISWYNSNIYSANKKNKTTAQVNADRQEKITTNAGVLVGDLKLMYQESLKKNKSDV